MGHGEAWAHGGEGAWEEDLLGGTEHWKLVNSVNVHGVDDDELKEVDREHQEDGDHERKASA